jgi:hypothetical protein
LIDSDTRSRVEKSSYRLTYLNGPAGTGYFCHSGKWFEFDVRTGKMTEIAEKEVLFAQSIDPGLVEKNIPFDSAVSLLSFAENEHLLGNKMTSYNLLFTVKNASETLRKLTLEFLDDPKFCGVRLPDNFVEGIKMYLDAATARKIILQALESNLENVKKCLTEEFCFTISSIFR